jgi:hypothetical protein
MYQVEVESEAHITPFVSNSAQKHHSRKVSTLYSHNVKLQANHNRDPFIVGQVTSLTYNTLRIHIHMQIQ